MRCPTLAELPAPPAGRTGWPWTVESPPVDATSGIAWPSITVVVPSYQQGEFIEETLRSVLLQGYPSLELLVMDGGSKDATVDIIKKYEPWIAGWVSAKDGGQSSAINAGWRRSTGELLTWLNSDDTVLAGWAQGLARPFVDDAALDVTYCDVDVIDRESRFQWLYPGASPDLERLVLYWKVPFAQQGFLMRRRLLEAHGYIDESFHFAMDAELWLRLMMAGRKFLHVASALGAIRVHAATKTSGNHGVHIADMIALTERFFRGATPAQADLVDRARRRSAWNAAHIWYDNHRHAEARREALRHLREDGWRATPRVTGMVALSLMGPRGHRLLELSRRLRARLPRAS